MQKYNVYAIKTDFGKPELIAENIDEPTVADVCDVAASEEWESIVVSADQDPNVIVVR